MGSKEKAPPSVAKKFIDYDLRDGLLYYRGMVVVPDNLGIKQQILQQYHDSPLGGHQGRERTRELIS